MALKILLEGMQTMLAFLGGTGAEGRGLALRFALAGEEVVIGSRDETKAQAVAAELQSRAPKAAIHGLKNQEAAKAGDVVFITVPYSAQKPLLKEVGHEMEGKVVVDTVVPLAFQGRQARAIPVEEGSAAMQAQQVLPGSLVVAAFHTVSAVKLLAPEQPVQGDVLVSSDSPEAKKVVMKLAGMIPDLRPVDAGSLENSCYVEQFTALLLNINRIYKRNLGIRIVGI